MANIPTSSDEGIITGFELLFRDNYSSVWRYVARRVPAARTDDVVSASFVVAWEKFSTVDNPSLPWLIRIASFEIANARRKQQREQRRTVSSESIELAVPSSDDFDGSTVRTSMATLGESDQEILRLVLWDELPREEIAQVLEISTNAVNVRFHRALRRFEHSLVLSPHIYPFREDPNVK
jgi:RNA polymerase sigma-70 factor (ECF subfamily)